MHNLLTTTIKNVMHDIANSYFSHDVIVHPKTTVNIGGDGSYEAPKADITAIIGFNGDIEGGLHLSAPSHVALLLAGALAGERFLEVDDTVIDAFGELANMIAGEVKESFGDTYLISLTPPVVVFGENNSFKYSTLLNATKQYFVIENAPFFVEVFY